MTPLLRPRSAVLAFVALSFLAAHPVPRVRAQVASVPALILPNGQPLVSELTVSGSQLRLAGDGTLFRSEDGRHWKHVKQQWQGKAVELLGIPALTPGSSKDAYVAVLLKSSSALHWVSVDRGKTWSPSTLDDVRRNDVHWSGE